MRTGALFLLAVTVSAADWPAFRGPNSSGISTEKNLPVEFGPGKNVVWKTALPPGHSSPVLVGDSIFLTAWEEEKLYVFSLNRKTGRIQWRRETPRPRRQELHKSNSPASPSVASDGKNVYAFFTDFGLISFGWDGQERWRLPLGPFANPFGMGASPLLVGERLILNCDAETGSFLAGVDKNSGKQLWRVERPNAGRGFSTPILYNPPGGPQQAIITGSYQLTSVDVATGKPVWWFRGLPWQLKPTPVLAEGKLFVLGWSGGSDEGNQAEIAPFADALKEMDKNGDKRIGKDEVDKSMAGDWVNIDLDHDGALTEHDWEMYRQRRLGINGLTAIKLGGKGDITQSGFLWRYTKSLPNVPSPLVHNGVAYLLKEGGILTALDAETGKVLKQGRITGALDQYYSSPVVSGDGIMYTVSQAGSLAAIKAGADWEILKLNQLDDECYATPALIDGRIYVRTRSALYAFANASE